MGCAETTLLCVFTELAFCPIAVVVRSKAWVCSRLLGLRVRISLKAWMSLPCDCFVLSHSGVCDGPIPPSSTGVLPSICVCVCVCVCACVRACMCRLLRYVHQLSSTPATIMYKKVRIKKKERKKERSAV